MFLRSKLTYAAMMLGLLTAFGAVVSAQQPATQNPAEGPGRMGRGEGRDFRRGPRPGRGFGPGMVRELNLTDDQKQQVRTIIQQSFTGSKATREELRQLGEKRRQGALTAEEQARAKTLHEQMRASMKDTRTKISGLLTVEQKTKAEELMKERRDNRQRPGGPRRGFRGQPGQGSPPAPKPSNPVSNQ
jgi:Spy/CpxP family protein refolding chaperone